MSHQSNHGSNPSSNHGQIPNATGRHSPNEQRTQVSRSVSAGSHRGDRRDTHPSFSTGKGGRGSTAGKARDGGRSGPLGAAGRKSGPDNSTQPE